MFCRRREWTKNGVGRDEFGVRGKSPKTADLQDTLIGALKGLAWTARSARDKGKPGGEADRLLTRGLYATLSNVACDPESLSDLVARAVETRERIGVPADAPAAARIPASAVRLRQEPWGAGGDPAALADPLASSARETSSLGLKGVSAYLSRARALGREDDGRYAFAEELLAKTLDSRLGAADWLDILLKTGEFNLAAMDSLDRAHAETFGILEPSEVKLGRKKGPAIAVSGHDATCPGLKPRGFPFKASRAHQIYARANPLVSRGSCR
jgi:hydroxylamine reductase